MQHVQFRVGFRPDPSGVRFEDDGLALSGLELIKVDVRLRAVHDFQFTLDRTGKRKFCGVGECVVGFIFCYLIDRLRQRIAVRRR